MTEFSDLIEEFVSENFEVVDLCPNCHDNGNAHSEPYDYKGSYAANLEKLFKEIKTIKDD